MTYSEALTATIPFHLVQLEIENHSLSMVDFINDYGIQTEYLGETVLNWLGY